MMLVPGGTMSIRKIKRITGGAVQYDGAGVKLVRVLGRDDVEDFDPFLLLDAFDIDDPEDYLKGFPWHPHRGIETVTYLIEGEVEHGDSLGNTGVIRGGECQWMTAGSGIIHQEMPQRSPLMLGTQLWVNLPQKDKMTHPAYRDITADQIPIVAEEGVEVRIISGSYKGTDGPMSAEYVKTLYLDIQLKPNIPFTLVSHCQRRRRSFCTSYVDQSSPMIRLFPTTGQCSLRKVKRCNCKPGKRAHDSSFMRRCR
jgi:redox-sensitive bicupin YhaK (pirin superfamily)